MINICYIDEDGRFGGPQQRMLLVTSALKKLSKKINIFYLIPNNKEVLYFEDKLKKNNFFYQKKNLNRISLNFISIIKYIFFFFLEIFLICDFVKKNNISIIQSNSTPQFKGAIVSIIMRKKNIWVIEDTSFPFIIKFIFIILSRLANSRIVYTSKKVKKVYLNNFLLKKNFKKEIFAPVDLSFFYNKNKKKKNKYIIITSISGIVPVKGLEYFIKAAELLLKKYKNLKFIFTGAEISSQKKYQKKIQNLLLSINNKKIINFGMCSNVRNLLKKTDIFVCTSLSEAGPITLYEAISMNIPVVTTKVGAVEQILKNNYSAIMVKKSDTESIAKGIERVLNNPSLAKKLVSNAKKSRYFFDLNNVSKKYLSLYENI